MANMNVQPQPAFLDVVKTCLVAKYADFNGRARRAEYWYFWLFNFIVSAVLSALGSVSDVFSYISGLYAIAVIVPEIAVAVRRLHDIGKSGWNFLWILLPIVGAIMLFLT